MFNQMKGFGGMIHSLVHRKDLPDKKYLPRFKLSKRHPI